MMGLLFPTFEHRDAVLNSVGRGAGIGGPDPTGLTRDSRGSRIP